MRLAGEEHELALATAHNYASILVKLDGRHEEIKSLLLRQMLEPVQWEKGTRHLIDTQRCSEYIEPGPPSGARPGEVMCTVAPAERVPTTADGAAIGGRGGGGNDDGAGAAAFGGPGAAGAGRARGSVRAPRAPPRPPAPRPARPADGPASATAPGR